MVLVRKKDEFTLRIEARRRETGVSPVKQGANAPMWFRKKITAAAKTVGLNTVGFQRAGMATVLLQKLLQRMDDLEQEAARRFDRPVRYKFSQLFDHPGTTRSENDDDLCFVLEPYPYCENPQFSSEIQDAVYELGKVLNCSVTWSDISWHYPDSTCRILFENWD